MNKRQILSYIFPNRCLLCDRFITWDKPICDICKTNDVILKAISIKHRSTSYFVLSESLGKYDGRLKATIKRFKFHGKYSYSAKFISLAKLMLDEEKIKSFSFVTFVPMSKAKQKRRGYNQAELLANDISKSYGIPVKNVLEKIKDNKTQHNLDLKDREKNVKGIYECKQNLEGESVLLVDDIITTGATISECAKMLYLAGAKNVRAFCIANTEKKSD